MKILITGGAGFIGTKLCRELIKAEHEIVTLDNFLPTVHKGTKPDIDNKVKIINGNVTNNEDWKTVFSDFSPEVVIHLAAETGTGTSLTEPSLHTNTNVNGTALLIENLQKFNITPKKIILTSSRAVYGEGAYEIDGTIKYPKTRELKNLENELFDFKNSDGSNATFIPHNASNTIVYPTNIYATTKLAQEHLLQNYTSAFEIPLNILRLQNVYGEGQALGNPYTGILVQFMNAALADETIFIYENGGIIRDFVHVNDVVSAIKLCIQSSDPYFTVDIGTGVPLTVEEVAEKIIEITKSKSNLEYCNKFRLGDVRKAYADISQANQVLGFEPATKIIQGLESFMNWSRTSKQS